MRPIHNALILRVRYSYVGKDRTVEKQIWVSTQILNRLCALNYHEKRTVRSGIHLIRSCLCCTDYVCKCMSMKVKVGTGQYYKWIEGFTTKKKNVLESTSYLLPLANKTSFTEWHAKPSRAPTLICLPYCCAILACSKVGT